MFAVVALAGLTACATDNDANFAERQELANTSPLLAVPKATGRSLTGNFERFCIKGSADANDRAARLRAAGFVPDGGWRDGLRQFVANDLRPAVRISRDGRLCAVRARAQTGQNAEIHKSMAAWFPQARLLKDSGTEQIWQVGPNEGIATARNSLGHHFNEIMLARIQL
ncbi:MULTISPECIES: hypothetical protein [unclassified Paracoccus (in: a-proteobacteria)]|uniref:hypothetical protein n=1 Tax=unclassified Paracoccus (in: a-proteobacteria) TaxID=2688777 RepID=UPI0016024BB3|nr:MULTISPECIES: hypothetical protein [unclassified Paracoccus (in: a-proteobacteria)]MBB1491005.1 hypothetical protein [Paracoccus sp. MC1854]MBB1498856.1 hypothetical protein [Paracoccus sp. MC1862]QQO45151.1 hypothetical protein JGR78_01760 [Paracoccus sp. MC1862]